MRPTREQIEQGTPQLLRIWCAQLMGWRKVQRWDWWVDQGQFTLIPPGTPVLHGYRIADEALVYVDTGSFELAPNWPLNTDDAFDLVDIILVAEGKRRGGPVQKLDTFYIVQTRGQAIKAIFEESSGQEYVGTGDSPSIAICRAALLWWIEQPETEEGV